MEGLSTDGLLQLQQQVVNAVASSTEGMHAATVFLLQLTSHPAFESIVNWLLTGHPEFPPLTVSTSRLYPLLLSTAVAPASPDAAAEQQQQREEFAAAAQLVGFNLLLQGVEQQWETGRWNDGQRQALKHSVLAAVVGPQIATAAELPGEAATAAATSAAAAAGPAPFSSESDRRRSGVVPLQTHASRMKCAQVLNAICRYEWPQKWPGLLPCLKAKAVSRAHTKPGGGAAADAGNGEGGLLGTAAATAQPHLQHADDEAFAAACVLLGLVRELSQEAKEDSKTQLTLQRRLQVGQGLSHCIDLILETLSFVLVSYAQHRHARHMQTLVAEVIREMAGVVDVALLLRQQSVLLYLVQEIGKKGCFNECRLQVLQAIDLMTCALSKKKSKRMAVEALNLNDLTVFIHCIVFLADAAAAQAAEGKFDPTDAEAFQLELTIADIVKHLCETCAEHLMKRLDCVTLSLLWHLAVLPLLAHPSLRIATCGAAASVALVKRMQLAATSQPAVAQQQMVLVQQQFLLLEPSPLDSAVIADRAAAAAAQQQRRHYLQLLQQHSLEQQEHQAFPCWFVLRSYLSLLFLRCLRVGDPALLHYMAVPAFTTLVDDIVIRLLSTAELPAACARAAAAAAADITTDAAQRLGCVTSPLLRTISALPGVRYAQVVKNWYRLMVRYSTAEDDLGSEALQGFAARYASMKSSALMPLGVCFSINTYAAGRVTTELAALSQLALTHPLFEKRQLMPDVLLRQQLQQLQQQRLRQQQWDRGGKAGGNALSVLPEKQQPWVCPGYVMLDACYSFLEAVVQRLKCASLSAAAASSSSGSDVSTSGRNSLATSPAASQTSSNSSQPTAAAGAPAAAAGAAFEWMLPVQAGEAKWAADAAALFSALLELQLFSPQDAAAATAAVGQQRAAAAAGSSATDVVQLCLYNYLLETRRLEFISGCAYFLRYPQVRVEPVLELLFTHILADCDVQGAAGSQETSNVDNAAGAAAWSTYPLGVEQQTYLCRRRALYTLISLCTSSPGVLSRFLGMMLQHVQNRLGRYHNHDNERSLLVESLVSLISTSQDFAVQQQHTVPLIRPYVEELRLVVGQLQQQDATRTAGEAAGRLPGGASIQQVPQKGVALLLFLFGDLQGNVSLPPAEERRLTAQRRALARLLAALESCIKRTCVPGDPVAAQKGGYITSAAPIDRSSAATADNTGASAAATSGAGVDAALEPLEGSCGSQQQVLRSFGESLSELLQSHEAARRQQTQQQRQETGATIGEGIMPRRHPLAALVGDLLPLIFELVAMLHELWKPEMARLFPAYASRLMLGEEEFQSLHGHTPLFSDPAALIEAVALTFPVEDGFATAATESSSASSVSSSLASSSTAAHLDTVNGSFSVSGGGVGAVTADGVEEQQLSAAGRAYVNSPVRLIRRHCYHLRCMLYRLLGSCCAIPDGFYVFPGLDVLLRKICINSVAFLPLQQLEQQIRLLWMPLLDPLNLPPHRIYPSQQLLLFMLQEGVNVVVQRLNCEWELIAESRTRLESGSGAGAVRSGSSDSNKEEEKQLNLYTLHVYAAMSVGDTLLALLKNLLHLGRTHHGTAVGLGGDQAGGMGSNASAGAATAGAGAEDDDHSGRCGDAPSRDKESAAKRADEDAASAAAAAAAGHLSDMRRAIYSSTPLLMSAVNALLEAQRWPNPATIIEAHSVIRTYVKSATKSFTPIPACTPEVCLHILRGVLNSFFEKRSFDPFSFSDAQQANPCLRGGAAVPQQQFRGSTPLQEFTNGGSCAAASSGSFNADSNVNSQVATYTATVYQVLRAFCRTLSLQVSGAETRKLQPSSLLLCPYALSAFNFFRAAELPVRLNDEEFERFVEAIMHRDSKEGKAFVKEFLQQNLAVLQQAESNQHMPRFGIKELKVEQQGRLSKLQPSTSCNLGSTFLSSVLQ